MRYEYIIHDLNSRVVGGGSVVDLHSIFSGSGLHISVLSTQFTIVTGELKSASHWMVTVDPGNLLVTGPKAPFVRLVRSTGQPPVRECVPLILRNKLNSPIIKLYSAVVLFPAQLVATILTV